MTLFNKFSFFFILVLVLTGCSSEQKEEPLVMMNMCTPSDQLLEGTILGQPYIFREGIAESNSVDDEISVFLFETNEAMDDDFCNFGGVDYIGIQITFFITDGQPESQEFSLGFGATLYNPTNQNAKVSSSGCYEIISNDGNTISGKLTLEDESGENMVSGAWTAKICS